MHWYFQVLKKYAVFSGRAGRKEFWTFQLVQFIILILLTILDVSLGTIPTGGKLGVFATLYVAATLLPALAVGTRRLHDANHSGWWLLLGLTGIGGIVPLAFTLQDSYPADNQYGPNPKAIPPVQTVPTPGPVVSPRPVNAAVAQGPTYNPTSPPVPQTPANSGNGGSPAKPATVRSYAPGSLGSCPSCGAANQGSKFCRECGTSLLPRNACAACGASLDSDSRFCRECGAGVV